MRLNIFERNIVSGKITSITQEEFAKRYKLQTDSFFIDIKNNLLNHKLIPTDIYYNQSPQCKTYRFEITKFPETRKYICGLGLDKTTAEKLTFGSVGWFPLSYESLMEKYGKPKKDSLSDLDTLPYEQLIKKVSNNDLGAAEFAIQHYEDNFEINDSVKYGIKTFKENTKAENKLKQKKTGKLEINEKIVEIILKAYIKTRGKKKVHNPNDIYDEHDNNLTEFFNKLSERFYEEATEEQIEEIQNDMSTRDLNYANPDDIEKYKQIISKELLEYYQSNGGNDFLETYEERLAEGELEKELERID